MPEVLAVPDQWVLSVKAEGRRYLLRVENLTSKILPLPPPDFVEAFKAAWRDAERTSFANRWGLRDKALFLATTAFNSVARDHLQWPRSMIDIVVEQIAL